MTNYPMTERMKAVRECYKRTPVAQRSPLPLDYGNHHLTLYWLEGYLESRNAPTTMMRRSYAQVAELDRSRVLIEDGELLVGQTDYGPCFTESERFYKLWDMYCMAPDISFDGRSDHMALDYRKLLRVGVEGLIQEIHEEKAKLTFSRDTVTDDVERDEFYDAALMELEALVRYAGRYEAKLRELAETETDDKRRKELLIMADNMAQVPRGPAKTFWQALQSIHFYTFVLRGLYSGGRLDQDLLPYYEADIAAGVLTREFAQELVDNYCLTYAIYIQPNCAAGIMVGGTDEQGNPVENDLTWLFMYAVDHIRMPDPNLALSVTEHTSESLLQYAMDMIGRGCTFPSFWNDAEIVRSLTDFGIAPKDAHRYVHSTCVELTIVGKSSMWTTAPYHNLTALFLEVFQQGDYPDYASLEKAYFDRVRRAFAEENRKVNRLKLERSRNASEPMLHSCLVDDCIRRGRAVGNGGAVYGATLPNVLGFANVIDSLTAIRELVFEKKELTLAEYRQAVSNNYAGQEELRQRILNKVPHYGNDDPKADAVAAALAACMRGACDGQYTLQGDFLMPGIFSYCHHVVAGEQTGATPDGRLAGTPLADSAGPAQGRDTTSPTAALLSGTCWSQGDFLGGVAQNIRLSGRYFADEDKHTVLALLRSFFARGGCELQFNCVSKEMLEDAMEHPEQYGDLLVRIGGYSDHFVKLHEIQQREVMSRTDY